MTPATESSRSGAARAALAVVAAIAVGAALVLGTGGPGPDPDTGRGRYRVASVTTWDGGIAPAGTVCVTGTYLAPPPFLRAHSLDDSKGGREYVVCRTCAVPSDAGDVPLPGVERVPEPAPTEAPWESGQPEVQCWMSGTEGQTCACAPPGGTCEARGEDGGWMPAPLRVHFAAGQWRGACVTKACGEMAGTSSWPAECGPESVTP
jgi:hypothetical protein